MAHSKTFIYIAKLKTLLCFRVGSLAKAKYNPLLYCYLFLTKGATGIIQSPGYPDAYTANVDCLWLLETGDLDDRIFLDCHSIELGMYCLFSCYWRIIEFD